MTTKELTKLARETFGSTARGSYFRGAYDGYYCAASGARQDALVVYGDTRAEAEARFVACLRAIKEVK